MDLHITNLTCSIKYYLRWDAVPALFLSIIVALFATGNMKTYTGLIKMINNTAYNAISDIAGLIIMLFVLNMFQAAAVHAMADFNDVFKHIIPDNTLLLTVIMVFLAPLAYFRGPLFLYGAGQLRQVSLLVQDYLINISYMDYLSYLPWLEFQRVSRNLGIMGSSI